MNNEVKTLDKLLRKFPNRQVAFGSSPQYCEGFEEAKDIIKEEIRRLKNEQ